MSTLVINTVPNPDAVAEIAEFEQSIKQQDPHCKIIHTEHLKISHCIGCNFCWLKTPGICCIQDDYEAILKEIIAHDKIVLVTETRFGFVTSQTKNLLDRILPIATMYLHFGGNQMRHVKRYDIHPDIGVVYMGKGNRAYLNTWLERTTLNFEGKSLGAYPIQQGKEMLSCI